MTTIDLTGVRGAADLQLIVDAPIELPAALLKLLSRAPSLTAALKRAREAEAVARTDRDAIRTKVIAALVAGGPAEEPGAPVRTATRRLEELTEDVALIGEAAAGAWRRVPRAFVAAAPEIAGALVDRLAGILADARPAAKVLAATPIQWSRAGAIAELDGPALEAFKALEPLAAASDRVRRAALALDQDLRRGDESNSERLAVRRELDAAATRRGKKKAADDAWIELFVGGGLQGPARRLVNTGLSPAWNPRRWAWAPEAWPEPHPVARLVEAALAPEPEPVVEPEPDVVVRKNMRPIRSAGALLRG